MRLDEIDMTAITTGIVTVAIVIGVIVLAVTGTPIPEILIISMSTVLGYIYGRSSGTPATAAHTRALRENTVATQAVATTLENTAPLTATLANTVATNALTAVNAAQAMREFKRQDEVAENTEAVRDNTIASEENTAAVASQNGGG